MKDGNFLLPKSLAKREFADVPQKKRKEWLIRRKHLENLACDIAEFFKKPANLG